MNKTNGKGVTRAGRDVTKRGTFTLHQEQGTVVSSSTNIQSQNNVCQCPRAAITDYHKLRSLKPETYCPTVPEARSVKSRCWQNWFILEVLRVDLFYASSQFLVADSNLWSSLACSQKLSSLPPCLHDLLPSMSVSLMVFL